MIKKLITGALLASAAVTPVLAQKATKPARDPNRVVCRSEEVIGSRLGTKRTCLTVSQWEQLERDQRMTVEHVQVYRATGN